MGCLLELIVDSWFALMQWIVPEKRIDKRLRTALQILVGIFTVILFVSMFWGIFALVSDDADTKALGKYMVFIPLAISVVQIILGIVFRMISKK